MTATPAPSRSHQRAPTPATVGILHFKGAQRAAVYGLQDLLQTAAQLYQTRTGRQALSVSVWPEEDLTTPARPLTAVILPPSLGQTPPTEVPPPLAHWLLERHAQGTTLCSVCVGAFLLAELGLLDGRPATTHWGIDAAFRARFPQVDLRTDALIVDDGDIITAGGLMAWVDLGLKLVGRFLGPEAMLEVARVFLIDPGGREQRFYRTFSPSLTHGDEAVLKVQRWLQQHLTDEISVSAMARIAALGERTLMRRFKRATGLKTGEYVQHLRVARARDLLERTVQSQQEIAWAVGYEDVGALRKVFVKLMGLTPGEYRRRFGCAGDR